MVGQKTTPRLHGRIQNKPSFQPRLQCRCRMPTAPQMRAVRARLEQNGSIRRPRTATTRLKGSTLILSTLAIAFLPIQKSRPQKILDETQGCLPPPSCKGQAPAAPAERRTSTQPRLPQALVLALLPRTPTPRPHSVHAVALIAPQLALCRQEEAGLSTAHS